MIALYEGSVLVIFVDVSFRVGMGRLLYLI